VKEIVKAALLASILTLILICMLADLMLGVTLLTRVATADDASHGQHSLPCEAIPTQYVLEEPECADKLLRAMNVTNVRVRSAGSRPPLPALADSQ
jgi:hypothetical protein